MRFLELMNLKRDNLKTEMKMEWEKLGLIYKPNGTNDWKNNSALTPTPLVFEDKIRIYAGFRNLHGVSRIGFVDLDVNDPTKILRISDKPALDIGKPGSFDDNGVILGDVFLDNGIVKMYYVGFQLVEKVKFLAFSGLAISHDGGENFVKVSSVPILDRKENALFFNAIHTVIFDEGKYKFWLGAGSEWQNIKGIDYPSYNVKYVESNDGRSFTKESLDCLNFTNPQEYRIGRPRVYKSNNSYSIIFTYGTLSGRYEMGYATSKDGKNWKREDDILNFKPSAEGWDDKWVSYGALFKINKQLYMVYNGNEMGRDGFGLAILKNQTNQNKIL